MIIKLNWQGTKLDILIAHFIDRVFIGGGGLWGRLGGGGVEEGDVYNIVV